VARIDASFFLFKPTLKVFGNPTAPKSWTGNGIDAASSLVVEVDDENLSGSSGRISFFSAQ
jgi:hypothetical protein